MPPLISTLNVPAAAVPMLATVIASCGLFAQSGIDPTYVTCSIVKSGIDIKVGLGVGVRVTAEVEDGRMVVALSVLVGIWASVIADPENIYQTAPIMNMRNAPTTRKTCRRDKYWGMVISPTTGNLLIR